MTRLEYVASRILGALHLYETKHGNYSRYIAKVALAAAEEPIPEEAPEPTPTSTLDDLFA